MSSVEYEGKESKNPLTALIKNEKSLKSVCFPTKNQIFYFVLLIDFESGEVLTLNNHT